MSCWSHRNVQGATRLNWHETKVCVLSVCVCGCLQLCGTGALEAGPSDFNTYGRSGHDTKKSREPFGMEEKNDPGYGPFCCQLGHPTAFSAPGDIGMTCATFAGVPPLLPPGEGNLDPIWFVWFTMENATNIRIKWVGQSNRRHVVDVCENSSWCDYSEQHTEVWLEIHALFGKLTMAAFNLTGGPQRDEITLDNGAPDSLLLIKHEKPRHHV